MGSIKQILIMLGIGFFCFVIYPTLTMLTFSTLFLEGDKEEKKEVIQNY